MAQIYIAFVDTPGIFAGIIRRVIRQKYIHVAISLDPYLEETYSIGRRFPSVPLIAGFTREKKEAVLHAFPDADYMICRMECTVQQKQYIEQELNMAMERRYHYHYAVAGLPFILMNVPFYQKNHYTCSSYLARLLEDAGICRWEKHFSLVTPRDFMEYKEKKKIYEGSLREFVRQYGRKEAKRRPFSAFMHPAFAGAACLVNFLKRGERT